MMSSYDELETYLVRYVDDNPDPRLTCDTCGAVICELEHGDSLGVLARTAVEHECVVAQTRLADWQGRNRSIGSIRDNWTETE